MTFDPKAFGNALVNYGMSMYDRGKAQEIPPSEHTQEPIWDQVADLLREQRDLEERIEQLEDRLADLQVEVGV